MLFIHIPFTNIKDVTTEVQERWFLMGYITSSDNPVKGKKMTNAG